jgi:hypothetical protein
MYASRVLLSVFADSESQGADTREGIEVYNLDRRVDI